ncbi:MAG: DUF1460 domain-containing protein [Bacteroidales bacterium]|nr:DUF1460 domain-containing protein [Bacteroidales bacterium]
MKTLSMFSLLLTVCMACSQPKAEAATGGAEVQTAALQPIAGVEYQKADSLEVVKLLADGSKKTTLDYARHFLGRPYVAYTLDGYYKDGNANGDAEHLVVNLREFDCLTLLETCNALAMTRAQLDAANNGEVGAQGTAADDGASLNPWDAYCRNLETLRYFDGHEDGYLSRIHYLSMSIDDHLKRGTMEEVVLPERITRPRTTVVNFMTQHPQYYYALKANPDLVPQLADIERIYSNAAMRFLPQENCGLPQKAAKAGAADLSAIHDGDLLYIVTNKGGLDYSHQGFAFWEGGKLHMLHASSAKKQVIADPLTLEAYLTGIKSNLGVRVFRLKL